VKHPHSVTILIYGRARTRAPIFLCAGLNVVAVAYAAISTDYDVRDGGAGSCMLP